MAAAPPKQPQPSKSCDAVTADLVSIAYTLLSEAVGRARAEGASDAFLVYLLQAIALLEKDPPARVRARDGQAA
jgi:hypothetical protein